MNQVEERLNIVESALAEFIIQSNRSLHRLEREMLAFKDEMREFKNEMRAFKNEMRAFKNEMQEDRRKMNKQWGELANKMGTLVEDIVAPAVRPAIQKHFQEEVLDIMVSRKKYDKQKGLRGEFDVIAITDTSVYLVDSKMSPNKEKLLEFKNKVVPRFRQLFPEYKKLQMVPIFAALRFDQELVDFGTKEKVYMLAYREWDYMDILNFEALKTK
ncbi:MAG: hypothetical protein H6557_33410 [Lewinellaceae bacterium]|nr:hypothetical protein [Phaeodactylibacter sp.]MCB9041541.1 hypothetical protein [Lewinellaceae bacterium]